MHDSYPFFFLAGTTLFVALCGIVYHLSRSYPPRGCYGPVPMDQKALHVILVHGTWARGMIRLQDDTVYPERWFEKGSKFFNSLDKALKSSGSNYVIDTLIWSGANSVLERDRAANELAIRLVSVHEQNPEIESAVIGHSHGGNIAMRAAHYLYKSNVKFRIVTLATPFARVAMRTELNDPNVTNMYTRVALSLGSTLAGIALMILIMVFSKIFVPSGGRPPIIPRHIVVGDPHDMVVGALVLFFIYAAFFILTGVSMLWLLPVEAWQRRAKELAAATVYPIATSPITKLLVLRGIDDEASLVLSVGAINALLSRWLLKCFSTIGLGLAYLLFFLYTFLLLW